LSTPRKIRKRSEPVAVGLSGAEALSSRGPPDKRGVRKRYDEKKLKERIFM
jgi:hypothetical protein